MSEVNDSFLEASNEFLHKINKEITRFNQKQNSWQHLSLLFSKRYGKKIQINSQIFLEALLNLILSVQVISLVYDPNSTIGNWDETKMWWTMVSYFNIFDICADSENVLTCFYITITFISVCTFCIIMSMILAFYGKHFKFVNNSIVKKFITLLASVMYIPCLLILFGIFNYDTAETGLNQLQIGAISLFFVICLIIIRVLYELFTADLAHANTKKNIRARTNSNLDLILILFNTILVFSSTFTKDNHFYLQEAILVFSVVIFKLFHMRLPYYNPIENVILCFKMLSIAITTAGFMIAYLIDSAHVVIIFYFVLQPVALILLIQNVKTRQMNLSQSVVTILSQDDFELKYRDSLCNKKLVDKERVLNAISTIYHDRNIAKNNLLLVWEFYFCYHVVKDESLARIKLSKLSNLRRSVEGYFQEWKINKILKNEGTNIEYIQYLLDLDKSKNFDKELCLVLLKFWGEIVSKYPNITKINKLLDSAADLLDKSISSYKNVLKHSKSVEAYNLFSTFWSSIANNIDDRLISGVKSMLNSIQDYSIKADNDIGIFGEHTGNILISANDEDFGLILYVNPKAAQYLKISVQEVIGTSLSNFIPIPYSLNHNIYLTKFVDKCTHLGNLMPSDFIMQNSQELLFECKLIVKYIDIGNGQYFLASIRPFKYLRQVILFNPDGTINGYSAGVPHILDTNNKITQNIFEFFPQISTMNNNQLYKSEFRGKEISMVFKEVMLKSTRMCFLYIIEDESEIRKIKKSNGLYYNNFEEEIEKPEDKRKLLLKLVTEENMDEKYTGDSLITMNKTIEDNSYISKNIVDNPSKSSKQIPANKKLTTNSEKANKQFIIILLISTVVMVSANIVIIVTIYSSVSHTISLNTFDYLGNIYNEIITVPNHVRSIDLDVKFGKYNLTRDMELFTNTLAIIDDLKSKIFNNHGQWDYCPSSEIVKKKVVNYWDFEKSTSIKQLSLYDLVDKIILNGQNLINALNNGDDHSSFLKFLSLSPLNFVYDEIERSINGLIACEENRLFESSVVIKILLLGLFGVLVIVVVILLLYVVLIEKEQNALWVFVRKSTFKNYINIKSVLIHRLLNFHDCEPSVDDEFDLRNEKASKIKSCVYMKYFQRLIILFGISVVFYLLSYFYTYTFIEKGMKSRPKLLNNYINRCALLAQIGIYARELGEPLELYLHPESYNLKNSSSKFLDLVEMFNKYQDEIRSDEFQEVLSSDDKVRLFEHNNNGDPYLVYGETTGSKIFVFDAYNIATLSEKNSDGEIQKFIMNLTMIQEQTKSSFDKANHSSVEFINKWLLVFIETIATYSILLLGIYCLYYLPFLLSERRNLEKIKDLVALIPQNYLN